MIVVYQNASMSISEQVNVLYKFMKSDRLYNSEATFITSFQASKKTQFIFGDDLIQRTYNKYTIPEPSQLEKAMKEAGRTISCVASVDPEDDHRVSCTIINEALALCAYDAESTEVLKKLCKEILC